MCNTQAFNFLLVAFVVGYCTETCIYHMSVPGHPTPTPFTHMHTFAVDSWSIKRSNCRLVKILPQCPPPQKNYNPVTKQCHPAKRNFPPVDPTSKRLKEKTPDLITNASSLLPREPTTIYRLASSSSPSLSVSSFLVQNGKRWRLPLRGALSLTAWPDPDPAPGDTVP